MLCRPLDGLILRVTTLRFWCDFRSCRDSMAELCRAQKRIECVSTCTFCVRVSVCVRAYRGQQSLVSIFLCPSPSCFPTRFSLNLELACLLEWLQKVSWFFCLDSSPCMPGFVPECWRSRFGLCACTARTKEFSQPFMPSSSKQIS